MNKTVVGANYILTMNNSGLVVSKNEKDKDEEFFSWDEIKEMIALITLEAVTMTKATIDERKKEMGKFDQHDLSER